MPDLELSRRKVLAGLGAIGAASAGSGYGTSALFSDREAFVNNRLVAGTLDMRVGWETHYADASGETDELEHEVYTTGESAPENYVGLPDPSDPVLFLHPDDVSRFQDATRLTQFPTGGLREGTDPCVALGDAPDDLSAPLVDFEDVKPGDFGEVTFTFALCDNPGYVWFDGRLRNASENGVSEAEAAAAREDGDADSTDPADVELLDVVRTVLWYDGDCDNVLDSTDGSDERVVFRGTLREFLTASESGHLLDGAPGSGGVDCFQPSPAAHCLGFAWWLPAGVDSAVLSDSVTFDLGFYTEQCRHNVVDGGGESALTDISFVAFCVPDDGTASTLSTQGDTDVTLSYDGVDGAPSSLSWDTGGTPISTVVVKAGRCGRIGRPVGSPSTDGMTNFYPERSASGTVTACMGEQAGDQQCPQAPAPEGERTLVKFEYDGGSFVESDVRGDCKRGPEGKGEPKRRDGSAGGDPDRS
ncbi:MAG: hypothetical protein ABEJ90_04725 [Halobacterium sp.]